MCCVAVFYVYRHVVAEDMLVCVSSVCCSVLQCVAVCCSVLQCVAVCCSVLQCVAVFHVYRHNTQISPVPTCTQVYSLHNLLYNSLYSGALISICATDFTRCILRNTLSPVAVKCSLSALQPYISAKRAMHIRNRALYIRQKSHAYLQYSRIYPQ